MSELTKRLGRAGIELGLRVEIEPRVALSDGRVLLAAAHFPDLGTPRGMFVFPWEQVDDETARALHRDGQPASLIGEPLEGEEFSIDDYVEMFREWGWSATDRDQPAWMSEDG